MNLIIQLVVKQVLVDSVILVGEIIAVNKILGE